MKNHQNRSHDCAGADVEPVEQTDDGRTDAAVSAADPAAADDTETVDENDADLDPGVGPVPADPDAGTDEGADPVLDETDDLEEDADEAVPGKETYDGRHRVRREPSTVREVAEAQVSGRYLCLDCGFSAIGKEATSDVKAHDFRVHGPYTREDGDEYRQLEDVPADELRERWLVIYKNVGSNWTHPKEHEAR